jgi:hypothetical protein
MPQKTYPASTQPASTQTKPPAAAPLRGATPNPGPTGPAPLAPPNPNYPQPAGTVANNAKQRPSRGRIVDYFHAPSTYTYAGVKVTSIVSPAVVQAVNADGTLRLHVFGAHALWGKEGTELIPSAPQAPTNEVAPVGTWQWPARV